jgi:CheY-like chemotaxis protein
MARILIVEDDLPLRRVLTMRLVRQGHGVTEADGVATACEALQAVSTPFDVILLDINLPDGTGWDVLRGQEQGLEMAHSRVIVMTALRPTPGRLREFQPSALVLKPCPLATLLQLIDHQLARPGEPVPCDTVTQPQQERVRSRGR